MPNQLMRKYVKLVEVPAGESYDLDRDIREVHKQQFAVIQDWLEGTDATTTGISASLIPGVNDTFDSGDVVWATEDPATIDQPPQTQPALSLGAGANRYVTIFNTDMPRYSEWLRLRITNNDLSKTLTLSIWGNE